MTMTAAVNLRGARVLITGGAGLIGSHIADRVVAESAAEVIVLDNFVAGLRENLASASRSGRVRMIDGDIRDAACVQEAMRGVDVVFHQAALRITLCPEEPAPASGGLLNCPHPVLPPAVPKRG